jgi:cyclic beta-1,2-glucan synthetase
MLNPINHARTPQEVERYRVEPYVACGDVYSMQPNAGRGGWTWYSGSAAWMYRTAVEYILGVRFAKDRVFISPVIPKRWPGFEVTIQQGSASYVIVVDNTAQRNGVAKITLDGNGTSLADGIDLQDDGKTHRIDVIMGVPSSVDSNAN